jgi:flagellar motility protein MotE (MotC chaperone)
MSNILFGAVFAILATVNCSTHAEQIGESNKRPLPQQGGAVSDTQRACSHIANVAREARNELQQKQLLELEQRVRQRLSELEAKKSELESMLEKHDALVRKADQSLVDVYSRIRPEAAAAQMANLEEEQAASLLMQLRPKFSSAILNEMEPAHAAAVIKRINALASPVRSKNKP